MFETTDQNRFELNVYIYRVDSFKALIELTGIYIYIFCIWDWGWMGYVHEFSWNWMGY
jgi:hypothetical protein